MGTLKRKDVEKEIEEWDDEDRTMVLELLTPKDGSVMETVKKLTAEVDTLKKAIAKLAPKRGIFG